MVVQENAPQGARDVSCSPLGFSSDQYFAYLRSGERNGEGRGLGSFQFREPVPLPVTDLMQPQLRSPQRTKNY